MTPDEQNMLNDLANKIAQTPAPPKDPEAEDFIRTKIGSRPDALYLMTQTVLIQNLALQHAQQQHSGLAAAHVPASPDRFRGGRWLRGSRHTTTIFAAIPRSTNRGRNIPVRPHNTRQPRRWLRRPAACPVFCEALPKLSAGVAAGTLAVQGIESRFSHHSGFGGGGLFGGSGIGGYAPPETVIENNYYGDPQGGGNDRFADTADTNDSPQDYGDDSQTQDAKRYDSSALGDDSNYDDSSVTTIILPERHSRLRRSVLPTQERADLLFPIRCLWPVPASGNAGPGWKSLAG